MFGYLFLVKVLLRGKETICDHLEAPAAAAAQEQEEEQSRWFLHLVGRSVGQSVSRLLGWSGPLVSAV